ncbi:Hypothetical predicted protein [Lecanosticta acicola]|uniref:Uncharacterized protein n=1 Tax=Lecanosticta acicola TaxID=111012 RepID=A0AAI8YYX0_9PEZI|nr:Hypothetical predicted protein [Lecanosticta acicola]
MGRSRSMMLLLAVVVSCAGLYYYEAFHDVYRALGSATAYVKGSLEGESPDTAPDEPPYGAVVAARQNRVDLSWMTTSILMESWETYPYNVDNPQNSDPRLRIPKNKGHEAMVYLSFIIDNYDSLPWCTFFIHGHFLSWHQETPISRRISSLNRTALAREGYISLRCDWYPSCPAEIRPHAHDAIAWGPGIKHRETEEAIAGNWRQLFPGERLPETLASPCCAQFAVTRKAMRRRPRADYERMREWLLGSLLEDEVSGRVFEKLWAYIFVGDAVHCPPPQQCACEFFGQCEEHEWQEPPEGLQSIPNWP